MNWVKNGCSWGEVKTNLPLKITGSRQIAGQENCIKEEYIFKNENNAPVYINYEDITIQVPFPDEYKQSSVSLTNRCHTHIWCGESNTYILGLRMNGQAPHLGLILTEGSIGKYSIERDANQLSNDRGIIFIHPSPTIIYPGQEMKISWDLLWVDSRRHFEEIRLQYENQVEIVLDNFISFGNEPVIGKLQFHQNILPEEITLVVNDQRIPIEQNENNSYSFQLKELPEGEYTGKVSYQSYHTTFRFLIYPHFNKLFETRVNFIADYQQHAIKNFPDLNGAYLAYDNEESRQYYSQKNDYNGGRERLGMGIAFIRYLKKHEDEKLRESLRQHTAFVMDQLVDTQTGEVFNDFNQNNGHFRLYNYPWLATYFYELYELDKDQRYIEILVNVLNYYYRVGGLTFYPIVFPVSKMIQLIERETGKETANQLKAFVRENADYIIQTEFDYPGQEVNYEQSIVAPAILLLLEMYDLSSEEKYLEEAKKHLEVLELFQGYQPDHHLYYTSIRHWDGYWFGKSKLLGDTFPHYWSALNGIIYLKLFHFTKEDEFLRKANYAIRGCVSLVKPDGTGSCAYLYPYMINHQRAEFYDLLANDQDWILYFLDELLT